MVENPIDDEISLADLIATYRTLVFSGANIVEMNTIRKHLSAIQGGRLAAATRARVLALIVSDVTGDDPTHIASGPCASGLATARRSYKSAATRSIVCTRRWKAATSSLRRLSNYSRGVRAARIACFAR